MFSNKFTFFYSKIIALRCNLSLNIDRYVDRGLINRVGMQVEFKTRLVAWDTDSEKLSQECIKHKIYILSIERVYFWGILRKPQTMVSTDSLICRRILCILEFLSVKTKQHFCLHSRLKYLNYILSNGEFIRIIIHTRQSVIRITEDWNCHHIKHIRH